MAKCIGGAATGGKAWGRSARLKFIDEFGAEEERRKQENARAIVAARQAVH